MVRKSVAVIQPTVVVGGGAESIAAWILEALKEQYRVTLLTISRNVTADALNQYYGTELRDDELTIARPPLPQMLTGLRRFSLFKNDVMMRYCKLSRKKFDLYIVVGGGMDFGVVGIQYFCFSPGSEPAENHWNWRHLAKSSLQQVCQLISGYSAESMRRNKSLVLSEWAARTTQEAYALPDATVVYPAVVGPSNRMPWSQRAETFLCIARIVPQKRIDYVIELLGRVRKKGFNISLRIIGRAGNPQYLARVRELAEANASWVHIDGLLSRRELREVMDRSKYGINALSDEPFGIAIAEMVKAGCIVFVPDDGGQKEIIDTPELIFDGIDQAVDKITRVLSDSSLQESMLDHLERQGEKFSTGAFCQNMRRVVQEAMAGG